MTSLRLPLYWDQVEPASPMLEPRDWGGFDRAMEIAARHWMRVLPVVTASPAWVAPQSRLEPLSSWQRDAWASFVSEAVHRYGPDGSFWHENPELPYLPIHAWEIWSEENLVTFGRADPHSYATMLRVSGRVIHRADPEGQVIVGGLFGRPLQVPPNVPPGAFLKHLYRTPGEKRYFDGVALHPYVADARPIAGQIRNLRRIMRNHHDSATPIYVTELGWGSNSYQSRWERGMWGQARELDQAFSMLTRHRRAWHIAGVWWFSWADIRSGCQFCDSAGLLTEDREAKPAWYEFNKWTGGDSSIVPYALSH